MGVGAQRDWELVVERGACGKLHQNTYSGARRRLAVGAQREWECIVGQQGVGEAACELRVNSEKRMGLPLFPAMSCLGAHGFTRLTRGPPRGGAPRRRPACEFV